MYKAISREDLSWCIQNMLFVTQVRVELANVLTHAHACGVVNGDLKPSHIRVDDEGR